MSATKVAVFNSTLQKTEIWLSDIAQEAGLSSKQHAYRALRAVLHALRDRVPVEEAAQLGAQLPLLIRGIYYEGWDPTDKPVKDRSKEAFLAQVYYALSPGFPDEDIGAQEATRAVLRVLARHVSAGEVADVRALLPREVRGLWA